MVQNKRVDVVVLPQESLVYLLLCSTLVEIERLPYEMAFLDYHLVNFFLRLTRLYMHLGLLPSLREEFSLKLLNICQRLCL